MVNLILLLSEFIECVTVFAECAGLSSIPEGDWYCPSCEGKGEHPKRKSTRSSGHLFAASVNEKQSDRCQRIVKVSKNAIGGCVICK